MKFQIDAAYTYQLEMKRLHLGIPSLRDRVFGVASGFSKRVQAASVEVLKLIVDSIQSDYPGISLFICWSLCLARYLSLAHSSTVGVLHWQDDKLVNTVGGLGLLSFHSGWPYVILPLDFALKYVCMHIRPFEGNDHLVMNLVSPWAGIQPTSNQ